MFFGTVAYLYKNEVVVINKGDISNSKPEEFKEITLFLSDEFVVNQYEKMELIYAGLKSEGE